MDRSLSEGWELMKKSLGAITGFTLIVGLGFIGSAFVLSSTLMPISTVLFQIGSIVLGLILSVVFGGIYIYIHNKNTGKEHSFASFFKLQNIFGQALLLHVFINVASTGVFIIASIIFGRHFNFLGAFTESGLTGLRELWYGDGMFFLIVLVSTVYINISLLFAQPILMTQNVTAVEAIKLSWHASSKKFFQLFGYSLVIGIVILIFTFLAGLFAMIPILGLIIFIFFVFVLIAFLFCALYMLTFFTFALSNNDEQEKIDSLGQFKDINTEREENQF